MEKAIDLAIPGYGGELSISPPTPRDEPREPDYPTLHLEGDKSLDLPDEGTITFAFRRITETETKRKDGTERYSCTLEMRKLLGAHAPRDERPSKSDTSSADALDSLMKAHHEEKESEY